MERTATAFALALLCFLFPGCCRTPVENPESASPQAQPPSSEVNELVEIIDDIVNVKDLTDRELVSFLATGESEYRWQAADEIIVRETSCIDLLTPLLAALDAEVRSWAAICLGKIGLTHGHDEAMERATPLLVETLEAENRDLRIQAASTLGRMGDFRALPVLTAFLDSEHSTERGAAVLGLGGMKHGSINDLLIRMLKDKKEGVRTMAARILGERNATEAFAPMVDALRSGARPSDYVCIDALLKLGGTKAIKPILEYIAQAKHRTNDLLVEIIVRFGPVAVDELLLHLADEKSGARKFAAAALGRIGNLRAVQPLIQALNIGDSALKREAAEALGHLKSPEAFPALIDALKDENLYLRKVAADALGEIGGPEAYEPLIAALKDKEPYVHSAAAWQLGLLGDVRACPHLRELLTREDGSTSFSVAAALGFLGDNTVGRQLESLWKELNLEESDGFYFVGIACGLVRCRNHPKALEFLLFAARDRFSGSCPYAVMALGRLRRTEAIKPLGENLADEDLKWLHKDTMTALSEITRLNYGQDRTMWLQWLAKERKTGNTQGKGK